MTFLNDILKKIKTPKMNKDWRGALSNQAIDVPDPHLSVKKADEGSIQNYEEREAILNNLKTLKRLVNEPKEEALELRFSKIKQHLGQPESYETVRQERWNPTIYCPKCHSTEVKRIAQLTSHSTHNHRYHCLKCQTEFNDDTGTPLEQGLPPLNIWMQCWYLMGCTQSLIYIASKLNLDLALIELMVQQLQKTFNATKPLTRMLDFEEWDKQSTELRKQLNEDLIKNEALNANIATTPKDTNEFRRQQNLRRKLNTNTDPPSPTIPPTHGKKR